MLQNKSFLELNFQQKSKGAYISIIYQSGAREVDRLPQLTYYNVQEWESRFTMQQNTEKNTDYIKN